MDVTAAEVGVVVEEAAVTEAEGMQLLLDLQHSSVDSPETVFPDIFVLFVLSSGRGGAGMKGGAKVIIEAHRHEGVFIARSKEDALVTLNSTPGKS